jgi:D-serine dehydratase
MADLAADNRAADDLATLPAKGVPWATDGRERCGWNVFDGTAALPVAVLLADALTANIATMDRYCRDNGVQLAPHGKTTMCPEIIRRQLAAGAWAITVATAWQAATVAAMGAVRILLANEVTDAGSLRLLAAVLSDRPDLELWCYVDSIEALALIETGLPATVRDRVRLLIELGVAGGRAGIRPGGDALGLGRRIAAGPLALAGVAAFEGVIDGGSITGTAELVDGLIDRLVGLAGELSAAGLIGVDEPVLTVGGSAWFDRVVAVAPPALAGTPWLTVLRSGCYVTHDSGSYDQLSPLAGRAGTGDARLRPAVQVIAAVLSIPEPGLAIVGLGRRDASFDAGLPVPLFVRHGDTLTPAGPEWTVTAVNDQHAYLHLPEDAALAVGELVVFGISHPCTTFDKWRTLPIVDADHTVIEIAHTHF